ncbi:MAG TPA: hypothetical protein VMG10_05490 [Gemmataceae bacterium]|nr:hypothetical protein [Gemmataceae bacterium]
MSPRAVRYCCGALLVLVLSAAAPPKDEEKKSVEVSVVAILASKRDDKVDPKLGCIARQVRKTHKELTGFRLATMSCKPLSIGSKSVFEVVEAQKVGVTVQQGADAKHRVEVKVSPPGMGEITYDTCCGKFLPIITPFHTKDNELLIIAVCVRGR